MTIPFNAKPGLASPWRSVNEMLRHRYEAGAKQVLALIADRKAKGVPTDDLVDWRADVDAILLEAKASSDRDAIGALVEKALAITNGGLRPWPAFEPDEGCIGLEVKLRALSKADVFTMRADLAAVEYRGLDIEKRHRASAAAQVAARPFLVLALVGVRATTDSGPIDVDGLTPSSPEMPSILDDLDAAGLLGAIFTCARDFQDLPVFQRAPYGLPLPSTSERSTAASVHLHGASNWGVTAAPSASISPATPTEKPIGVLVGTSSTMPGLGAPSIFTDSVEVNRD